MADGKGGTRRAGGGTGIEEPDAQIGMTELRSRLARTLGIHWGSRVVGPYYSKGNSNDTAEEQKGETGHGEGPTGGMPPIPPWFDPVRIAIGFCFLRYLDH